MEFDLNYFTQRSFKLNINPSVRKRVDILKIYILLSSLFFLSNDIFSQNRNSIWCFGDSAGLDFSNVGSPTPFVTGMDSRGTCASIADSTGNLLFYADARANGWLQKRGIVYNKYHQPMANGDSIHSQGLYEEMIIIPKPGDANIYYLFSLSTYHYSPTGIYLSTIDMNRNNGLGEVIEKNMRISQDSVCGAMAAIKHANGRDWWLLIKSYSSIGDSMFYEFFISPDTIIQKSIAIGGNSWTPLGTLTFNKQGSKLAFVSFTGLIETFNFDRCSGTLFNSKIYHPSIFNFNNAYYFGAAFSPNSNLLYISDCRDTSNLFQFDLTALNIWNSRDTLASIYFSRAAGGNLRLAPDNKIYWSCEWDTALHTFPYPYSNDMYSQYNMNLSVINNPDIVGAGCNLNLFSVYLGGKRTYWGLPNNPDYELGSITGNPCDTINNISESFESKIKIYPNPTADWLYLSASKLSITNIKIHDIAGKLVDNIIWNKYDNGASVSFKEIPNGIYFLTVYDDDNSKKTSKVIVAH